MEFNCSTIPLIYSVLDRSFPLPNLNPFCQFSSSSRFPYDPLLPGAAAPPAGGSCRCHGVLQALTGAEMQEDSFAALAALEADGGGGGGTWPP